jgi:hypothetical protein
MLLEGLTIWAGQPEARVAMLPTPFSETIFSDESIRSFLESCIPKSRVSYDIEWSTATFEKGVMTRKKRETSKKYLYIHLPVLSCTNVPRAEPHRSHTRVWIRLLNSASLVHFCLLVSIQSREQHVCFLEVERPTKTAQT